MIVNSRIKIFPCFYDANALFVYSKIQFIDLVDLTALGQDGFTTSLLLASPLQIPLELM